MFLLLSIPIGLLIGALFGGKVKNALSVTFSGGYLLALALFLQIFLFSGFGQAAHLPSGLRASVHVASYGLLLVFFARNLRITGMLVICFGMLMNLVAIIANGGFMPTTANTLVKAGFSLTGHTAQDITYNNVIAGDSPLIALGDVFTIPKGWPLSNAFSAGDVVVAFGSVLLVATAMSPRSSHNNRSKWAVAKQEDGGIELQERLLRRR
ncbi:MAG: DUF5317 domain-containing protein [Chloroflexi bacterium]|nr:DUF5317 domain-containing protein [Chloroflexota bacterium]